MIIRVILPGLPGKTDPIYITTFDTVSNTEIDQDKVQATTYVESITSQATAAAITSTNYIAN